MNFSKRGLTGRVIIYTVNKMQYMIKFLKIYVHSFIINCLFQICGQHL